MKILIIYAHPFENSFNHALKESIESAAALAGHEAKVRDLYQINFDPVLSAKDLADSQNGITAPDVLIEQQYISWADLMVFVYPLWWAGMPAIMRGYLDRVFSYGFAYTAGKNGTLGLFNHKRVVMVNTIGASSAQYSANGMLSALETIANPGIFNFCGTKVERFFHLAGIPSSSAAERQQMLADVHDFFRNLK